MDIIKLINLLDIKLNQEFTLKYSEDYKVFKFTEKGLLSAPLIKDRENGYFVKDDLSINELLNSKIKVF